ncbi:MAG TPA: hydrogenase iron-sulfur subunit [Acidobacteriota bacterium]|nr:hydrogenase iron-sulfur subunit [Acidobacteriota bacterium]
MRQTEKRLERLWSKLEKLRIDQNRLQLAWISAAEGEKFASKIREMQKIVDGVTKEAIKVKREWIFHTDIRAAAWLTALKKLTSFQNFAKERQTKSAERRLSMVRKRLEE